MRTARSWPAILLTWWALTGDIPPRCVRLDYALEDIIRGAAFLAGGSCRDEVVRSGPHELYIVRCTHGVAYTLVNDAEVCERMRTELRKSVGPEI